MSQNPPMCVFQAQDYVESLLSRVGLAEETKILREYLSRQAEGTATTYGISFEKDGMAMSMDPLGYVLVQLLSPTMPRPEQPSRVYFDHEPSGYRFICANGRIKAVHSLDAMRSVWTYVTQRLNARGLAFEAVGPKTFEQFLAIRAREGCVLLPNRRRQVCGDQMTPTCVLVDMVMMKKGCWGMGVPDGSIWYVDPLVTGHWFEVDESGELEIESLAAHYRKPLVELLRRTITSPT